MQYHQIVIFTHRPWVSKSYIQPRSPRQGPGYHHARRMCIESSTAVAQLLHLYEKHYTFRRMNNQVVAIIFSAALMLLYVTISHSQTPGKANDTKNTEMVAYLNLCFRALDELGQSFENAKRTRDFLVSLQRRWQARMRRSGSAIKRQVSNFQRQTGDETQSDSSRKKSRVSSNQQQQPTNLFATLPSTSSSAFNPPFQHQSPPTQPNPQNQRDIDWIRNSDFQLLSGSLGDGGFPQLMDPNSFTDPSGLPNVSEIESWWENPDGNFGGSSM